MPPQVVVIEGPIPESPGSLWAEESGAVKGAVPKRAREFAAGRAFARRALVILGVPPGPLPIKRDRSPLWPPEIVGSLTHTADYCAVAVARTMDASAIGIDVEDWSRFDPILVEQIFSPAEMHQHVADSPPHDLRRLGTLIFSAKEAIYKCLSTQAGARLSFRSCTVHLDHDAGTFSMIIPATTRIFAHDSRIGGRFALVGKLVATAITLPPER